jgi:hypothetical protein
MRISARLDGSTASPRSPSAVPAARCAAAGASTSPRVKGRGHGLEQNLGRRDRDRFRDPLGRVPGGSEQAVVGADEKSAVPGPKGDVQVTAHEGVDDCEDDRVVPDVRQ